MTKFSFNRLARYGFLAIGAIIAIEALKAYRTVGNAAYGAIGGTAAVIIFLLVQGFELRPIFLTGGKGNVLGLMAGGANDLPELDPAEYRDAQKWALTAYLLDFGLGLYVFPFPWDVMFSGGFTVGDLVANRTNLILLLGCVFGLQFCVNQYLARGGKFSFGRKVDAPAN